MKILLRSRRMLKRNIEENLQTTGSPEQDAFDKKAAGLASSSL